MHKSRYVSVLGRKINGGGGKSFFVSFFVKMWEKTIIFMAF